MSTRSELRLEIHVLTLPTQEKLQFTNEIFRIQSLNGGMRAFGFYKVQSYPEGTTCNLLTPKHSAGKRLKRRQTQRVLCKLGFNEDRALTVDIQTFSKN
ncbi:hypothetical protein V1477_001819 [Vespula maculifrons]|uniref:Uncharacterized protein n=1 Tax=Vespula maculifrons TaxID=7453 RepID=A0ABD2D019_VESMC